MALDHKAYVTGYNHCVNDGSIKVLRGLSARRGFNDARRSNLLRQVQQVRARCTTPLNAAVEITLLDVADAVEHSHYVDQQLENIVASYIKENV